VDVTPYIGTIVSVVIAFVGFYGMVSTRLARTEQKIDDLAATVEKHNSVVERTAVNERDIKTAFRKLDELTERDDKLEAKIEKFHE
jgi:DNA repair ATPase RecN